MITELLSAFGSQAVAGLVNANGIITPLGSVRTIEASEMVNRLTLMAVSPTVLAIGLVDQKADGARILSISIPSALETFPG